MSEERLSGPDEGVQNTGPRLLNPWVLAALAGLVLIPAIRPLLRFEPDPPPVLRELPQWRLVDQNGEAFGSDDLAGEVYVASFLFTRCATVCPRLTASLRQLERRYREEGVEDVRLVSFTVDPAHDTPDLLRDYARSRSLDLERWSLVTGAEPEMRSVVVDGFALPMGERLDLAGGLVDVAHAARLALVDRDGGVRGYYGSDAVGLDEVFHRTRQILAE
ncbi:MAG: SCO family protein [Acidobacteriota bacterium]|nr:SCO family protein [Acidobacteriota bacterium]MDE2922471.1 SCO family protein [Acidobacteriota bacterium]MDE3266196.1 SCO family protein [Acidobacteriota bacterium]